MICDNCDRDIDIKLVENNLALCCYCRYNPDKYKKPEIIKHKHPVKQNNNRGLKGNVISYKAEYKKYGCCFYRGESSTFGEITIDHFRPKSKGGQNENNRLFACYYCNGLKGNLSIDEFRGRLMLRLKMQHNEQIKNKIRAAINTCSLILNDLIKPPLF